MAKAATNAKPRAPRVKLAGTVLSLVCLENGRQTRGRLHQLSVTGGLLHLETPLDEGIKVEVIFHVGESTVRTKARMLFPMWATQGYLQPFEFVDLGQEDRSNLQADLQRLLHSSGAAIVSAEGEITEVSHVTNQ
ncbi:MAG: hypothetical protein WBE44_13035 [Terriglobales bacterium]|jgi:hypothetical protein